MSKNMSIYISYSVHAISDLDTPEQKHLYLSAGMMLRYAFYHMMLKHAFLPHPNIQSPSSMLMKSVHQTNLVKRSARLAFYHSLDAAMIITQF